MRSRVLATAGSSNSRSCRSDLAGEQLVSRKVSSQSKGVHARPPLTSYIFSELPESSRWAGVPPLLAEFEGHFLKRLLRRPLGEAVEFVVELLECWRNIVLFSVDRPILSMLIWSLG